MKRRSINANQTMKPYCDCRGRRLPGGTVPIYLFPMPCRVYVQLKDVSKPSIVRDGESVSLDKDAGELTVKDATGEIIGWFQNASVTGWWREREPIDLRNLSPEDLRRVAAEIQKLGIMPVPDLGDKS
jgi:hypothetical protein